MKKLTEKTVFLFLIRTVFVICETYYCENGVTQTISDQTNGTIRTVRVGTSFYDNNLNCGWIINGGVGTRIQLIISHVNLQLTPVYTSCGTYDHLSIIDGDTSVTEAITSICGERNPYEVISTGQYVYLKFYSNDKNFYDHSGVTVNFKVFGNSDCPPDWTHLDTSDQCFRIRKSSNDWYSAYHNCIFSQANLAVINEQQIFDSLQAYAKKQSVTSAWVGLTDITTENVFKWLNNENLANWIRTEGNTVDYDCAMLNFNTQKFEIKHCERTKYMSVCQSNRVNSTEKYSIPKEEENKETDFISLRWQIILGIAFGVILIIIAFFLYWKFHKADPALPTSSLSARYKPPERSTTCQPSWSRTERSTDRTDGSRTSPTFLPGYSEIPQNNSGTIQFNPQINVNVTVNQNGVPSDRPPSYSFYAPTA